MCFSWASPALAENIAIGVLAYDGKAQAVARWQPTAEYLSHHIPAHQFQIVPLSHDEFEHGINKDELSFILTNPGHYARLEVDFGVTRIATFLSRSGSQILKQYSSVIFTRSNSKITRINDLKGHTMAAVSKGAFGGFQLAQDELLRQEVDVLEDMDVIWLGFPQSDVVRAVLSGKADVGTVRSGVLEKLAGQHVLELSQIRVLGKKQHPGFPLLHSVELFPEWPLAKLASTDTNLAKQVVMTLLQMRASDVAATKSAGAGWTIPLNYAAVHQVLRRLEVEPYPPVKLSLIKFWQAYRQWIIIFTLLFLFSLVVLVRFFRANRQLQITQQALHKQQGQLEEAVNQRTDELHRANLSLQDEITYHEKAETILNNGCEALQSLYSIFLRADLTRQQRLNSIVDSVRQYLGAELALLSSYQAGQLEISCSSPSNAVESAPLCESLSQLASIDKQILIKENADGWQQYIVCPVYIKGELHCLLELATSTKKGNHDEQNKDRASSELSLKILNLVSQWIGFEAQLLEREEEARCKHLDIQQRFAEVSSRENDVLALLVQGESTKAMALRLNLSTKTIEMHRANLIRKTGAKSSTELVQLAVLSGIIQETQ